MSGAHYVGQGKSMIVVDGRPVTVDTPLLPRYRPTAEDTFWEAVCFQCHVESWDVDVPWHD